MSDNLPFSSVRLSFRINYPSDFMHGDNLTTLVESLKASYVRGDLDTELFEEYIDAWLRYGNRAEWWSYSAYLELRSNELDQYPTIVQSCT